MAIFDVHPPASESNSNYMVCLDCDQATLKAHKCSTKTDLGCPHCDGSWTSAQGLAEHILHGHGCLCGKFDPVDSERFLKCHVPAKEEKEKEEAFVGDPLFVSAGNEFVDAEGIKGEDGKPESFVMECNSCANAFENDEVLAVHLRAVHNADSNYPANSVHCETQNFKCPKCEKVFQAERHLKSHTRRAHKSRKCPNCDQAFNSRDALNDHLSEAHKVGTLNNHRCSHCLLKFRTKKNLVEHTRSVHKEARDWKCPACEKTFNTEHNLRSHTSRHCFKGKKCTACNQVFASVDDLGNHLKKVHDLHHKCVHCSAAFELETELESHTRDAHNLSCALCDSTFTSNRLLHLHALNIHEEGRERKHACTTCEKAFYLKSMLNNHVKFVHLNIRDKKCDLCPYTTGRAIVLKRHMRLVHEKEKGEQCSDCKRRFGTRQQLQRHVKEVHLKIKDEYCPVKGCSYASGTKTKVKRHHEQVHLKLRNHTCPAEGCQMAFYDQDKVRRHHARAHEGRKRSVHKKVKSDQCPHCKRFFVSRENLQRHVKEVHLQIKDEFCSEEGCDFAASTKTKVKRHNEQVHLKVKTHKCPAEGCQMAFYAKEKAAKHYARIHEVSKRHGPKAKKRLNNQDTDKRTKTTTVLAQAKTSPTKVPDSSEQHVTESLVNAQLETEVSVLRCELCDYSCSSSEKMWTHVSLKHLQQSSEPAMEDVIRCKFCNFQSTRQEMPAHVAFRHRPPSNRRKQPVKAIDLT